MKKQEKVEIDEKAEMLKRNDLMSILANVTLTDGYTNRKINLETMSEDLSDAEIEQLAYYMIETMKTMRNHRMRLVQRHTYQTPLYLRTLRILRKR